jgi:hypothetical protein
MGGGTAGAGGTVPAPLLFISESTGTANLSTWALADGKAGLPAADAVCQAEADAAGLEGTFVAWISDSSDDAYCRVHGFGGKKADNCGQDTLPSSAGGWRRTDGVAFVSGIGELVTHGPFVPVRLAADGTHAGQGPGFVHIFWTGTGGSGEARDSRCSDWTGGEGLGVVGEKDGVESGWTYGRSTPCSGDDPSLLCFQLGDGPSLGPPRTTGKLVFVSSVRGNGLLSTWPDANGNSGLTAADAVCRARATEASLPNPTRFKAFISDGTASALDRLLSEGPWVRLDGLLVAESKADIAQENLFTGIQVDEHGERPSFATVWTGTHLDQAEQTTHCLDWTSDSIDDHAYAGRTSNAGSGAFGGSVDRCSTLNRLYCFED